MDRQSGFTLIELMITIAIIAILSAIAIPNGIAWISNGRVNSAARDIVALIQKSRIEAVKGNSDVDVTFGSNCIAFVDNGQGTVDSDLDGILDGAGNGVQDGTERTIYSGPLPVGVTISGIGNTVFNSRAMPSVAGTITLANSRGYTVNINLGAGGIPTI
ncbi:GspH/FimT family pseudopilin [uncultured Desulfosarcina sp.]|uniref:GspH/FimT family pseudopilin n=1 Tax=uncultured Desulfosarcina sp. TaxID=218289 RepID=UPI0029C71F13|nr:GspH/FimT family pseudopilin [uncultured Desulfosarcina sp.]